MFSCLYGNYQDHRCVGLPQFLHRHIPTHGDIAQEVTTSNVRSLTERVDHILKAN